MEYQQLECQSIIAQSWKPLSRTPTLAEQPKPYMIYPNEEKIDAYEDEKSTDTYEDEEDGYESDGTEVDPKNQNKNKFLSEPPVAAMIKKSAVADHTTTHEVTSDERKEAGSRIRAYDNDFQPARSRPVRSAAKIIVNYAEPSLVTKLRRENYPIESTGSTPQQTSSPSSTKLRMSLFKSAKGEDIYITQEQDQLSKEILVLSCEPPKKRMMNRKARDDYNSNVSNTQRTKCTVANCGCIAAFKNSKCQKHGGKPKCRAPYCRAFSQKRGFCRLHNNMLHNNSM